METKNITILLIDNDRDLTSLVKSFLTENCGYAVEVEPDGYNGIVTAKKIKPALVLLDMRMPAMNGLDVLEKLKADAETASIPVIIFTGFADEEDKNKALALKAVDYLAKTISLKMLHEKVAAALGEK